MLNLTKELQNIKQQYELKNDEDFKNKQKIEVLNKEKEDITTQFENKLKDLNKSLDEKTEINKNETQKL
jgi:hypothetical protein